MKGSTYELVGEKKHSLEGEFSVAKVEQVLQTRAEEIQNHCVVVAFCAKPSNEGNADAAS